uniref:Ig-like domain-containing protein n=1 Tax=Callorhinchus milii TaxID=7868 RepID=A0A4W3H2Z9_CALMI
TRIVTLAVCQTQPQQAAFAGETFPLHCKYILFSEEYFIIYWYRQSSGEEMKYLLQKKSSVEGGNPTGERISASLDTAKKISVLTIADLRLTDSAMYHCALSLHHSDTHHRKPRTITLITTKAGKQYSTVSDSQCNKPSPNRHCGLHLTEFISKFLPNISPCQESNAGLPLPSESPTVFHIALHYQHCIRASA